MKVKARSGFVVGRTPMLLVLKKVGAPTKEFAIGGVTCKSTTDMSFGNTNSCANTSLAAGLTEIPGIIAIACF